MDSVAPAGNALATFPDLLTLDLEEAALFLRMHPVTLRNKARSGAIPGAKPGKQWVFLRVDLEAYLRSISPARVLQGDMHEVLQCHSTSERTPLSGGSKSVSPVESQYRKALGLPTESKRKNSTTDSRRNSGSNPA